MLRVTNKYMTPHLFFIPTFRFHSKYIATCAGCAGTMLLAKEKGRALRRGVPVKILPGDLTQWTDAASACPRCRARQLQGGAYCNGCGASGKGSPARRKRRLAFSPV